MHKETHIINRTSAEGSETIQKEITIYNMEDLTEENAYKIFRDDNCYIELDECPICGWKVTLNQRQHDGCYAWCAICGLEGPHHYDPYWAAKMFCDKSFTTVAKAKEFSPSKIREANLYRFSPRTIDQVREFIRES